MSEVGSKLVLACALCVALAGCGQKGPLYLPDEAKEVVTRPTQTPPAEPAPEGSNTPQTPDTPEEETKPGTKPPR